MLGRRRDGIMLRKGVRGGMHSLGAATERSAGRSQISRLGYEGAYKGEGW